MGVIHLPAGRLHGPLVHVLVEQHVAAKVVAAQPAYCDSCAGPIDFGAVFHGARIYCSVECSIGGVRPPA